MVTVTNLLEEHRDVLTLLAEELLEKETIVLADLERMVEELRPGKYPSRMKKASKVKKMKVSPQPEESEEEKAEENIDKVTKEQPEDDTQAESSENEGDTPSDDSQNKESENP